jgi:hypothetical protein
MQLIVTGEAMAREGQATGKWRLPHVPHRGWSCIDIYDLGEPEQICEMCEVQEIRYVHVLEHPNHTPLEVGCICAGAMEGSYEAAAARERECRRKSAAKRRWLGRAWRTSAKGNEFLNAQGFNVVIFERGMRWGARVEHRQSGEYVFLDKDSPTSDGAKLAALSVVQAMREQQW